MNFSKIIHNQDATASALKKLGVSAINLFSVYSKYKDKSESSITANYVGIAKCNQLFSDLKTISCVSKDTKRCNEIGSLLKKTLSQIKSNLNTIALELEPEDYKKDVALIIKILNDKQFMIQDKNHFIFPKENQIIIGTTIQYNNKYLTFSTVYTDSDSNKYLNIQDKPVLLEYFVPDILVENDLEDLTNRLTSNNFSTKLDNLIKDSCVFDNFIKSSVNDRVNIKNAYNALRSYFSNNLEKSHLYGPDLLFKFKSNLSDKQIIEISKILKLNNNDRYKFMALLKE